MFFPHPHSTDEAAPAVQLKFAYVNWRGTRHEYVIEVSSVEWGQYSPNGDGSRDPVWMLHGYVVTRDGDPRPELGDNPANRRRTFVLTGMECPEVVSG